MERMEVDQCAGAGGGALRRSNSAPMITNVSDGMTVFSPVSSARYRRSSVSINPSQVVPLSPFSLSGDRLDHKRPEENMETMLRWNVHRLSASSLVPASPGGLWEDHASTWFPSQDSGVTPNSSPSPTRRFRPAGAVRPAAAVRWPLLTPLKRKGGVDSDGPPKKLFVAGVTDPAHRGSSYTVSVSQATVDAPPVGGVGPQARPLTLSPPRLLPSPAPLEPRPQGQKPPPGFCPISCQHHCKPRPFLHICSVAPPAGRSTTRRAGVRGHAGRVPRRKHVPMRARSDPE